MKTDCPVQKILDYLEGNLKVKICKSIFIFVRHQCNVNHLEKVQF